MHAVVDETTHAEVAHVYTYVHGHVGIHLQIWIHVRWSGGAAIL
jgi:hypothetical protein